MLQQAYQGDQGPPGAEAQRDGLLLGCIYIFPDTLLHAVGLAQEVEQVDF